MGVRAGVFDRPDAAQISARLGTALIDAITRVVGDDLRSGIMVELVPSPPEPFVGGELSVRPPHLGHHTTRLHSGSAAVVRA